MPATYSGYCCSKERYEKTSVTQKRYNMMDLSKTLVK